MTTLHLVDRALPALLHLHGGGYVVGSPERKGAEHRKLAVDLACAVYSVDYRLAPETPFPGSINDCYAVVQWLHNNASQLGIDVTRIGVMGESAGGGLAASLALMIRDREFSLSFQQLISPMLDDRTAMNTDLNPLALSDPSRSWPPVPSGSISAVARYSSEVGMDAPSLLRTRILSDRPSPKRSNDKV
jgi:acetyl esterase/lipase